MTATTAMTINRQWAEFSNLMTAAKWQLSKLSKRSFDDQIACDIIAMAFESYQKRFSDNLPSHPRTAIWLSLHYAALGFIALERALKRNMPQLTDDYDVAENDTDFNPDRLNEALASLPGPLRETAYAVATLESPSEAARALNVTRHCVYGRLKRMRAQVAILSLCS